MLSLIKLCEPVAEPDGCRSEDGRCGDDRRVAAGFDQQHDYLCDVAVWSGTYSCGNAEWGAGIDAVSVESWWGRRRRTVAGVRSGTIKV